MNKLKLLSLAALPLLVACGEEPSAPAVVEASPAPATPERFPVQSVETPAAVPAALAEAVVSSNAKPKPKPVPKVAVEKEPPEDPVLELEWDSLVPADFRPEALMERFNIDALEDDDPRAEEVMAEMEELWANAPVVAALDGSRVKLPGFVVPLEGDGQRVTDFLLVPYFGACIHSPPPPANQTVYVVAEQGARVREMFDTVWVTGRLRAQRTDSELGDAGYRLEAQRVEPYDG